MFRVCGSSQGCGEAGITRPLGTAQLWSGLGIGASRVTLTEPRRNAPLLAMQVPHVHRRSAGPGRRPVHVLPLLHLSPDGQVPCADHSAVPPAHCGVPALCHRCPGPAQGEPRATGGAPPAPAPAVPLVFTMLSSPSPQVFLSIKGVYYQAEVLGQPIVWITPYAFSHDVSVPTARACAGLLLPPAPRQR